MWLGSLKLTVICLFLLIILILFGTLDQIDNGLYLAQQKYFDSWFLFIGPIPAPGAKLVMWVLFLNLLAAFSFKFKKSLSKPGILLTHLGLLILLLSGFITQEFSREAFVNLQEGESSNIASDYYQWNLLVLNADGQLVKTFENKKLNDNAQLIYSDLKLQIKKRLINARFFDTPFAGRIFKQLPIEKDFEKNSPALIIDFGTQEIVLDGVLQNTYEILHNQKKYFLVFKRLSYELPFSIKLIDVDRELHPGTQIAKSYKSDIEVAESGPSRRLTVSMNKPFRSRGYTAYQAGYSVDENGNEFSTLAIVKNPNFGLVYIASLIMSLGLFVIMFERLLRRKS